MYVRQYHFPPRSYGVFNLGTGVTPVSLRVDTESSLGVHAFVVDADNQSKLEQGTAFTHLGPGGVTNYVGTVILGPGDDWRLVVHNRNQEPLNVWVGFQRQW